MKNLYTIYLNDGEYSEEEIEGMFGEDYSGWMGSFV